MPGLDLAVRVSRQKNGEPMLVKYSGVQNERFGELLL